ncbi:ATP-grasp domain-containing protein [Pseudoalteromonas ardens]|nr:ATP-grasp domain-containing protein [Pseudoalteromonas sp. R96]MDK1312546.1 ATP-grasp domain-containing protein [Pseudoalteromonas sp. R96]
MKNVLVVPCGTEIGLEINRALKGVKGLKVIGLNSVEDSSAYEYEHFYSGAPYIRDELFLEHVNRFVKEHNITHVFPAHDDAALLLSESREDIDAKVITSSVEANRICRSKKATYSKLKGTVALPRLFNKLDEVLPSALPVFVKPDVGQGSKGAFRADSLEALEQVDFETHVVCEYLPGKEYTIDCYTSAEGTLEYAGPRVRTRIMNGIAVGTQTVADPTKKFFSFAEKLNNSIGMLGAWFFQVKESDSGELVLMEVATRIAGSMSTNRVKGVNFAELSLYAHDGISVRVNPNTFEVKQERNLSNRYNLQLNYKHIYVDFDDCIIINNRVNEQLIALLYKSISDGCQVHLVTRHEYDLTESLNKYRLTNLFDTIYHITDGSPKSSVIKHKNAIFIDDSFRERVDVQQLGVATFSIDSVEALL